MNTDSVSYEQAIIQLKEMFPNFDYEIIMSALLQNNNSYEDTLNALLVMQADNLDFVSSEQENVDSGNNGGNNNVDNDVYQSHINVNANYNFTENNNYNTHNNDNKEISIFSGTSHNRNYNVYNNYNANTNTNNYKTNTNNTRQRTLPNNSVTHNTISSNTISRSSTENNLGNLSENLDSQGRERKKSFGQKFKSNL